jgi:hypothetical protein
MTDRDYKMLLDAHAVAKQIERTQIMARGAALACAVQIEELIARCERIAGKEREKETAKIPF